MNDWQDALTELVTARSQALKRYAFLLCGNDAQAQDLVQDALVRIFSRTRPFTDVSGAEHYVRAAILTLYLDQQRRHATWRRIAHLLPRSEAAANHSPRADERRDVQAALAALSPRQRVCVVLRYYEDPYRYSLAIPEKQICSGHSWQQIWQHPSDYQLVLVPPNGSSRPHPARVTTRPE